MSDDEKTTDPDAKVYAPLLVQLESDHPTLAPHLIGIGDRPVDYDHRKTEVTAHFETETGTRFSGRYLTEPGTASEDAREFLTRMAGKLRAAVAEDRSVLLAPASPEGPAASVPVDPPGRDLETEVLGEDPEPETESAPATSDAGSIAEDDAGWNEPLSESTPESTP